MLALLLFGLLASGLPYSECQKASYAPKKQPDNSELLAKLNILGNELQKLGADVGELLDQNKKAGLGPDGSKESNWSELKVLKASREVGTKSNKFTVKFKAPEDCPSVPTKWTLKPVNQETATTLVSRVSSVRQADGRDLCETTVDVKERGDLTLTLLENNRYEIFLRLDNHKTTSLQSSYQGEVPINDFAVKTPDVVNYRAGEKLKLPVVVKNAGPDKYRFSLGLDIQYLTPQDKVLFYNCKEGGDDYACEFGVDKKYLSSMDADVSINTKSLKPIGYTRVSSTYVDRSALVQEARLTRVLSIRPAGQVGPYPNGLVEVKAIDNKCAFSEQKCTAKCIAYGNNIDEKSIKIERVLKGDVKEKIKEMNVERKVELGQTLVSTEFTVPKTSEGIRRQPFACSFQVPGGKKQEDIGIVSYKVETRVLKEKSFYEINESEVKITCTAEGDKDPEIAAVLSMKPSEKGRPVDLKHSDFRAVETGPGEVTSVFFYNHNYGQIKLDRVLATCFARTSPLDVDQFVLTDVFYLKKSQPQSLY
ncbi:uncharacterized protein LOC101854573 [Aplysia californica]|uniref:Uncharacterized protein LOC101854573 n=1 Tax=Aplysia californica TaxID=6500 RepID=A0ABM0JPQ6_APLCA|nr:uncharacterized protein LOC101854573 [Aplysia californica]